MYLQNEEKRKALGKHHGFAGQVLVTMRKEKINT